MPIDRPDARAAGPWTTSGSCTGAAAGLLRRRGRAGLGRASTAGWRRRSTASSTWHLDVPDVAPWSAEQPRLYPLHVVLRDPAGAVAEETTVRVGFRRVEIGGLDLLVNGARVFIRGVNRHDFDQHTGRVISRRVDARRPRPDEAVRVQRRADLALPERPGLPRPDRRARAVRHRRGRHRVARLPEHAVRRPALPVGSGSTACRGWPSATRTTRRSSSGRSATSPGYGRNHEAAAAWLRRYDPTRPLHYEGAIRYDWTSDQGVSDLTCPMYPPISAHRRPRPVGAAAAPADHVRVLARDGQQQRHAGRVLGRDRVDARAPGRVHLGVLGPRPRPDAARRRGRAGRTAATSATSRNDGNFVCDGMVWPDRRPKPAMWEHQRLAAPVRIDGTAADLEAAGSRSPTTSTSATWLAAGRVRADGRRRSVAGGAFELPALGPGERAMVDAARAGRREAGVGRGVPDRPRSRRPRRRLGAGRLRGLRRSSSRSGTDESPGRRGRARRRPERRRSRSTTRAASSTRAFAAPPALALWRAPTDNDRIGGMAGRWAAAGRRPPRAPARRRRARRRRRPSSRSVYTTAAGIEVPHEATYTPLAGGGDRGRRRPSTSRTTSTTCRASAPSSSSLPGLETLRWFGTGPHETYPDRKRGGLVGRWESTRRRPVRPVHPAAGERRPRRRPLARARRRGRRAGGSASSSTSRARSRPRTIAPPTSPPRPTTSTSSRSRRRSSTSTPPTAASAPRAAAPTRSPSTSSRPAPTAGRGPSATCPGPEPCRSPGRPRPASSTSTTAGSATSLRVHDNGTLGHLHFGAALDPARSYAPPRADAASPASRTASATRSRSSTRRPAPATTGSRRLTVEHADGSTVLDLVYREHRILAGKPARPGRRPAGDLRRGRRRGRHARGHPRRRAERPRGRARATRSSATARSSPGAPASATTAPTRSGLTGAMSAAARPARCRAGSSSS